MSKIEMLKMLDRDSVNALVVPEQILFAVREAFYLHSMGEGQVFPVVREALGTGGIFGIKSGGIANQGVLGFKAAGFWPTNRTLQGEPHQATILLIDPATGRPLQPGTHFNCVGADTKGKREAPDGLLPKAKIFVDDIAQARQLGETQWVPSSPVMEIGDLLTGKVEFIRGANDITLFDMTGLALQDLTVAQLLFKQANIEGIGHDISWPW